LLGHSHVVLGWAGVLLVESLARSQGSSVFGAPIAALAISPVPIPDLPFVLAAAAVGSLLPDIDHPRGALGNYRLIGIPILKPASFVASAVLSHRGLSHTLLAWALLTALGVYFGGPAGLLPIVWAASLGYGLHLGADSLTKAGVPWLWPLYRHPLGFPPLRALRIQTGGLLEHALVVAGLVLALAVSTSGVLPFR
jgi:inner membrane protein